MSLLRLATCSYIEFRPEMGVPVRFTAGAPRFHLGYQFAGHARLITPSRDMLTMPRDAYTLLYRRKLEAAGVDAIRTELAQFATGQQNQRVVLLCFERLNKPGNWCHRTIFAAWWAEKAGDPVPELGEPELVAAPEPPEPTLF